MRESFSEIEETISFYTRNDFAILNSLLADEKEQLWDAARVAYEDNRGILQEYEEGVREIESEYDKKWIEILQKRLLEKWDEEDRKKIISNARNDIRNILRAMQPAKEKIKVYRTGWFLNQKAGQYFYSHQYKSISLKVDDIITINTISSTSLTPYREEAGYAFYRYEINILPGCPVLKLDPFECHNEEGEVLLPPMKCKVRSIKGSTKKNCMGIIELDYMEYVPADIEK